MNSNRFRRRSIRSPFSSLMSHGEPWLWLTSGSLAISLIMIVGLLVFITIRGGSNFWPRTLYEITLLDGEKSLGEVTSRETDSSNSKDGQDNTRRRLVRTANFEVTGVHYKWFDEKEIASTQQPKFATAVERLEDGRFHGFPVRLMENGIAVASDPETAWAKYKEIAPSIRQRFREATVLIDMRRRITTSSPKCTPCRIQCSPPS